MTAVEQKLRKMFDQGRAAWPGVDLPQQAYYDHVARCLDDGGDVLAQLDRLQGADLYLACACARGDNQAIDTLEAAFARQIQMALKRMRNHQLLPEDFRQLLRLQLFVGTGERGPAIERYSGQGTLGAWVRVTALRAALNVTRGKRPREDGLTSEEDLFDFDSTPHDPELDHLKRTYRAAFRQAFLDTLESLSGRDKTLLRQSVIHGLSVREIARMHGVHHATVARWIASAREVLLDGTRRVLGERLRVSANELDSIMGLIESRLEVSIGRALGPG
jgi:RNA polymerase sigma-70 factor (ECF subfamily)